jgi:competence protein ComEC
LEFKSNKFFNLEAKITNQYIKTKKNRSYFVLKLKSDNLDFYTTSKENLKDILNKKVYLTIITTNITFYEYLTTFYAPSFGLGILRDKEYKNFISYQHSNEITKDIFNALYFADSLSQNIREKLSSLGISHLVALSGLHLGFLSAIIYFLLSPIYKFFQNRYFPYRNRFFDLGLVVLSILYLYLYFVDFPPSLTRSFVMEVLIFIFAWRLKDIFSFWVLFWTAIFVVIIFPKYIFSIGLFLSLAGVFYIYLFFHHFKFSAFKVFIILPFYLYLVMTPISHYFFWQFNFYSFLSPVVSVVFEAFYPVTIFLHLIGQGNFFDEILITYLNLGSEFMEIKTSIYLFVFLIIISFVSIFNKNFFYLLLVSNFIWFIDLL